MKTVKPSDLEMQILSVIWERAKQRPGKFYRRCRTEKNGLYLDFCRDAGHGKKGSASSYSARNSTCLQPINVT